MQQNANQKYALLKSHFRKHCLNQITWNITTNRRTEVPRSHWAFLTDTWQIQAKTCQTCGQYLDSILFYPHQGDIIHSSNGINRNVFFVEQRYKKIQCQCSFSERKKEIFHKKPVSKFPEFCYNCKLYDCTDCLYETDHEDNLSIDEMNDELENDYYNEYYNDDNPEYYRDEDDSIA
jgi:hypothetical protein